MECIDLPFGLKLVRPSVFRDSRGFFLETYQSESYSAAGMATPFVQDNHSLSVRGTLRGLHYQSAPGQAKLVRVGRGRIFDVAVDIRPESPTFGRWHGVYLDAQDHAQLYIPIGFAHGFCVVSDVADVIYKVSAHYNAATECGLRFDDPDIAIEWPMTQPILSLRDQRTEAFADYRSRHGR